MREIRFQCSKKTTWKQQPRWSSDTGRAAKNAALFPGKMVKIVIYTKDAIKDIIKMPCGIDVAKCVCFCDGNALKIMAWIMDVLKAHGQWRNECWCGKIDGAMQYVYTRGAEVKLWNQQFLVQRCVLWFVDEPNAMEELAAKRRHGIQRFILDRRHHTWWTKRAGKNSY